MTPRPVLVGRDAQLGVLEGLVASAHGQGHAVVVHGEAGIGKSSMLRAAAAMAEERGHTVLETTGVEAESALPYAGLHRLLSPLLAGAERLPATQRRALLTALGIQDGRAPAVFLVALATLSLLTDSAAERPVVAVVDDVQWLDPPSSEALAFVARRVAADPVLVVAGLRRGHRPRWWASGLDELELLGLDDTAARRLLDIGKTRLGDVDRELVLENAAGNPLALVELPAVLTARARAGDATVPGVPLSARLERAFAARLSELPDGTRDAMLVAAVDHEDDLGEILAAATVLAGRTIGVEDLEVAVLLDLLRFDEHRLSFRHPLVRSGILQAEPLSRRQRAHAALAETLRDQPYRRTWHRSLAIVGLDDEVADELEAVCAESIRRGWLNAAVRALERSAALTTDPGRRAHRLLLAAEVGFDLGSAGLVDRLLSAAERHPLTELDRARVEWLREIFNDGIPGDADRVMQLCEVADRAADAGDTDLALNLLLGAALRCWWADTGPRARARVAAVTDGLAWARSDPRHVAALAVAEPIRKGADVMRRLASVRLESITDPDALRLLGMAAHAVGDLVRAADLLDRAETRLGSQGRLGLLPHVLGLQGSVRLELGDWKRSAVASEAGRRLAADTGQPVWRTGTLLNEARLCGLRGDTERALRLAAEADHTPALRALNDFLACSQQARAFAFMTSGRYAEAYPALERLFDPADPAHHLREKLTAVMFLAEAAVRCGRVEDARGVVAEMEQLAEVTPSPLLHTNLLYARAVLADDEEAESLYRAALAVDLTRWPWHRARIKHAYGSWLRRQRRVAEARGPLRAAAAAYVVIGAKTWAEQARAELRATGERISQLDVTPAAAQLSPQELQIARLAAVGHSNREIAERLFLSPRTVGSHLYRIFPKLDITSRVQLAARLEGD